MKALKSDRARILLADPVARVQLRGYLESVKSAGSMSTDRSVVIHVHSKSGPALHLTPVLVPKAA